MLQTIKARALIACLTTMCVTIGIAGMSLVVEHRLINDLNETRRIATALRNHTIADMYHEGLQSSAYAALSAAELKVPRAEVEKELRERVGKFHRAISDNRKLDLPQDVMAALNGIERPLAAYIDAAEGIVKLAFDDRPRALAAMDDFNTRFEKLDGAMNAVGDRVESAANAIDTRAAEFAGMATATALASLAVGVLATAILLGYVLFGMVRPLGRIKDAMRQLAQGNFDVVLPGLGRGDEIGAMAAAVDEFKVRAVDKARREAEEREAQARAAAAAQHAVEEREAASRREAAERAAAERKTLMHRLAEDFETAVGNVIDAVSSASTELEGAADALTRTAETTQQLSTVVASASEQASSNVQSVASATEEMTGSVGEISRQVQESSSIASEAVEQAQKTDARITELAHAANRIGDVVKLITAIAEQTNLLALNATIEAARAGETGKGFAVVAQEVKALAGQTAKATGEIGTQIAGMQMATEDSVAAIKEIGDTIQRIAHITATIAAAVEEQGAATQEISRNVQEAAKGTAQVAGIIVSVSRGASETGGASTKVLASAQSLSGQSSRLKAEVRKFLETVRAA